MNLLTTKFENRLKHGLISDRNILVYCLLILTGISLAYYSAPVLPEDEILSLVVISLPIIIMIIGTKISFDINARGDNQDFFKRYIALNYAIAIRLLIITFIVAAITGFIAGYTGNSITDHYPKWVIEFTGGMILQTIFYSWIVTSFRRMNKNTIDRTDLANAL